MRKNFFFFFFIKCNLHCVYCVFIIQEMFWNIQMNPKLIFYNPKSISVKNEVWSKFSFSGECTKSNCSLLHRFHLYIYE